MGGGGGGGRWWCRHIGASGCFQPFQINCKLRRCLRSRMYDTRSRMQVTGQLVRLKGVRWSVRRNGFLKESMYASRCLAGLGTFRHSFISATPERGRWKLYLRCRVLSASDSSSEPGILSRHLKPDHGAQRDDSMSRMLVNAATSDEANPMALRDSGSTTVHGTKLHPRHPSRTA